MFTDPVQLGLALIIIFLISSVGALLVFLVDPRCCKDSPQHTSLYSCNLLPPFHHVHYTLTNLRTRRCIYTRIHITCSITKLWVRTHVHCLVHVRHSRAAKLKLQDVGANSERGVYIWTQRCIQLDKKCSENERGCFYCCWKVCNNTTREACSSERSFNKNWCTRCFIYWLCLYVIYSIIVVGFETSTAQKLSVSLLPPRWCFASVRKLEIVPLLHSQVKRPVSCTNFQRICCHNWSIFTKKCFPLSTPAQICSFSQSRKHFVSVFTPSTTRDLPSSFHSTTIATIRLIGSVRFYWTNRMALRRFGWRMRQARRHRWVKISGTFVFFTHILVFMAFLKAKGGDASFSWRLQSCRTTTARSFAMLTSLRNRVSSYRS